MKKQLLQRKRMMNYLLLIYLFASLGSIGYCNDTLPSPECSYFGTVGEFTDDLCPRYIALDNGDTIYPVGIDEPIYAGDQILLDYEIIDSLTHCTYGPAAQITCYYILQRSDCQAYFRVFPGFSTQYGIHASFFMVDSSDGFVAHRYWIIDGDTLDTSEAEISYTFMEYGHHTVCLEITTYDGCVSTYCDDIYVGEQEPCEANFTYQQTYPTFEGTTNKIFAPWPQYSYEFADQSRGDVTEWIWEYNGTEVSTDSIMYYTFPDPGSYEICLTTTTTDGCSSSICKTIDVVDSSACNAHFTYIRAMDSCWHHTDYNGGVQFFDESSPDAISWTWDFGDGSVSNKQNPYHEYPLGGTYVVCLSIVTAQGCVSNYCSLVTIGAVTECIADFKYCTYTSAMIDSLDQWVIGFVNTSTPKNASSSWSFGDGQVSDERNPVHRYELPGMYQVCLIITTDDCFQTICKEVYVGTEPCEVEYTHRVLLPRCYDPDYELVHQFTAPLQDDIMAYSWDMGDGTQYTEDEVLHVFPYEGDFEVCLTVEYSNGCEAERCKTIGNWKTDSVYFKSCGNVSGILQGVSEETPVPLVYPLPADHEVVIEYSSRANQIIEVTLLNVSGQRIYQQQYTSIQDGVNQLTIPTSSFENGTYYYQFTSKRETHTGKISVLHAD